MYFGINLVALIFKTKMIIALCASGKKLILSLDKFQFFPYNYKRNSLKIFFFKKRKKKSLPLEEILSFKNW